jgi:hypothetical protein
MPPPCIFCDHDSGSPEHLWPDWMHNTVKFAPINMQEADGPIITGQDPEQTITTVCHDCNTGWMCLIENKSSTRLKPMLLNQPIEIDRGGMKLLTQWAVLRAMVFESIKPKSGNEQFFTREERIAFKANQTIPERTRVWVGALENSHIGYHGTDRNRKCRHDLCRPHHHADRHRAHSSPLCSAARTGHFSVARTCGRALR